jgi:two-component system catabolic regulation response regulator CreB
MRYSNRRILFVDDHEDMHPLLAATLGKSGHAVVGVDNPLSALVFARNQAFDLVILDKLFTDGTGIDLCRRIREFDSLTPIVFFSGDCREAARYESINAGAQAYVTKPDIDGLLSIVNSLLRAA